MITGLFFTDLYNLYNFKCLLLVNINFQFEINYICKMKEKNLFPSIEPREKGFLQVRRFILFIGKDLEIQKVKRY